ncbi:mitogen-activated protein kinase kinase kinase 1-like [Curcuma longa]|uniref:mitogen-activated protein kinase kinase kinase 1-like n=1 Tax=Curcuma longa TaxID=136217 RepID=UPI003D9DE1F5
MDSRQPQRKLPQRQKQGAGLRPRLERCNALKHIEYEAPAVRASWSAGSSAAASEEQSNTRVTLSLDIWPSVYTHQTSFRIDGSVEDEVGILCRSLGLDGPEDFAISLDDWEKRKVRSPADFLTTSLCHTLSHKSALSASILSAADEQSKEQDSEEDRRPCVVRNPDNRVYETEPFEIPCASPRSRAGDGGIRGVRPPVLSPPTPSTTFLPTPSDPTRDNLPSVLKPPLSTSVPDSSSTALYNFTALAPEKSEADGIKSVDSKDEVKGGVSAVDEITDEELREIWLGDTSDDFNGTSSYSTMNDDDSSCSNTETFIISPNGRFKRKIKSWMRGAFLGSGSFGSVFEGISEEGVFFAVKEVPLLDKGCNAQQCILQLEQEIMLLSQFEHDNIVQYYGTDKESSKLYIFLELVTQGSLASLYQKYRLQDSQVSSYTKQILNGLNYLHGRNVVHRDIKCANILVHVNGSVKLADFGLAKEMSKYNMLKSCQGSVYWMAPEVVNPRRTYGQAADIWSLGCTVLEMLTRQIPYPHLELMQALYKIGHGEPPTIPDSLSRDARDFIRKCVQVNPDDRPNASELLEHPFVKGR